MLYVRRSLCAVHLHQPRKLRQPGLRNSYRARPSGPVALGLSVCSHMACVTVWAVPGLRVICASQHILLYGITIEGATLCPGIEGPTLCPGSSRAHTTSFALQGLLAPISPS